MAKLLFLDVETTGTDPERHGLIQLAGIIEIDGKVINTFNAKVRPFKGDAVNKEALKINGTTIEEIRQYPESETQYKKLIDLLDKFVDKYNKKDKLSIVGYNPKFDDDFLRAWFMKCGANKFTYGSYFWWPLIDVASNTAWLYRDQRAKFENFKLMTVAKALGVDMGEGDAHNAAYDVGVTRKLFYKLGGG